MAYSIFISHKAEDEATAIAVKTALECSGASEHGLTADNLPEVVAEAMVGLRLFCEPDKFGELMMDLTEYCEQLGPRPPDSTPETVR